MLFQRGKSMRETVFILIDHRPNKPLSGIQMASQPNKPCLKMAICVWSFQLWLVYLATWGSEKACHTQWENDVYVSLLISTVHWAIGGLYSFDCTSPPKLSSHFYFIRVRLWPDWQSQQTFALLYQLELWGQSLLNIRVVVLFQHCMLLCAHSTCRD